MAKRFVPPVLISRTFSSPEEIDASIAKLRRRIEELEQLDVESAILQETGADTVAQSNFRETIRDVFGPASPELDEHKHTRLWSGPMYMGMSDSEIAQGTTRGRVHMIGILKGLIGRLEEKRQDLEARTDRGPKSMESSTHQGILVFISHSSKDAPLALALIELLTSGLGLQSHQIRCSSVDGYRLPVGVNTETKLREEVNASRVVIGLITPNSLASAFVMFELGARWGANQFLAPLLAGVKPSELTGPLSLLNALSSNNEAQLHQLLRDVSKQLGLTLQDPASYVRYISAVRQFSQDIPVSPAVRHSAKDLVFEEGVYWKSGGNGKREEPYCPVCYDSENEKIHLTAGATRGTYECGVCKNGFRTKEYDAKPVRRRPFSSR
jgi:hypothetical protein